MSEVELVGTLDQPDPGQVFGLMVLGVHLFSLTCLRTEEVSVYECIVMGLGLSLVVNRAR